MGLDPDDATLAGFGDVVAGTHLLGLDTETAQFFGRLRSDLRAQGALVPDNDLWIAATALRHDLTLISRDSHFARIPGLKLLGPS